jgi:hypothetical protein
MFTYPYKAEDLRLDRCRAVRPKIGFRAAGNRLGDQLFRRDRQVANSLAGRVKDRGAHWNRTGCEGPISLLKRRHGLNRCRYKGLPGIRRWVGLGVIADSLINIGHALASTAER